MNIEERKKQLKKLLSVIETSINDSLDQGHLLEFSPQELVAICLEAIIIHEVLTGEDPLVEKTDAKIIPFPRKFIKSDSPNNSA